MDNTKNELPLPKKPSDIRALLFVNEFRWQECPWIEEFKKKLSAFDILPVSQIEHSEEKLGEYDIIMEESFAYGRNILGLDYKATEQCKNTGRQLVMLASYKRDIPRYNKNQVSFKHMFRGEQSAVNIWSEQDTGNFYINCDDEDNNNEMPKLIEAMLAKYEKGLISLGAKQRNDAPWFRTADDFYAEVDKEAAGTNARKEYLKDITALGMKIIEYNTLHANRYQLRKPKDILISGGEKEGSITAIFLHGDQPLASITFDSGCWGRSVDFKLATRNNKGNLGQPQSVCVHEYNKDVAGYAPWPNEIQQRVINTMMNCVDQQITPLIADGKKRESAAWKLKEDAAAAKNNRGHNGRRYHHLEHDIFNFGIKHNEQVILL